MSPTRLARDPYPGINPHLNSLLQTPGTDQQPALWPTFHGRHITYLCDFLNEQLPSHYMAFSEQSLQVRGSDWDGEIVVKRPEPDVSILQQTPLPIPAISSRAMTKPTWQLTIAETLDPARKLSAVVIRSVDHQALLGKIVTRIELLSPDNKHGGSGYVAYLDKRIETLQSGVPLVEIDYLHETPSLIQGIPIYPTDPAAYPYAVAISDPRSDGWQTGVVAVHGFHTDDALPTVAIPLSGAETIDFALNPVYQHTFARGRWENLLDYAQEPIRFATYSPLDQERIRRRINEIAAAR